jgi:tRNA nucleotidyltransferase (CCA-adding enzyme)
MDALQVESMAFSAMNMDVRKPGKTNRRHVSCVVVRFLSRMELVKFVPIARRTKKWSFPMITKVINKIKQEGGRALFVGGCVRDELLGLEPKDVDIEVYGLSSAKLVNILSPFGSVSIVGESFGVINLRTSEGIFDFSLPRRDSKKGTGHKGFEIEFNADLDPTEAASRRDFTINAMGRWADTGELFDPFGGQEDLKYGLLLHTSGSFVEDPLRVLRGFQFCGRFDLVASVSTLFLCRKLKGEFNSLPKERIWTEWEKWAAKSVKPSQGLRFLKDAHWLDLFPGVANMDGVQQDPAWHPEGDCFLHTLFVCDAMAQIATRENIKGEDRVVLMLAALCHDMGKFVTTEYKPHASGYMRWVSPGHDKAGVPIAREFLESIGCFPRIIERVLPLVSEHMAHIHGAATPRTVRRLALRLGPVTIRELLLLIEADHSGRPPLDPGLPEGAKLIQRIAGELTLENGGPKPIVMGRHLVELGVKPGPSFKTILDACFNAQLDGEFSDEAGGREFLKSLLANLEKNNGK